KRRTPPSHYILNKSDMHPYFGLLWTYDLLGPVDELADPASDIEGLAFAEPRERARSRTSRELDNDF
ncbi:MAG: hypothetical protein OXI90_02580, partial [Gammaproteobacteria bacterium]|nr:hypothetical protein [Gammaproteobacteria bacterium]